MTIKQEQNGVSNVPCKKSSWQVALPQLLAVGVKNVLLLGYGMTLGFAAVAIPYFKPDRTDEELTLTSAQESWIASINHIVVPLGCFMSGAVTTPLGRKRSMQAVNIPFVAAWLLFYFSKNVGMLYSALIITGLSGGLLEAPVLTYVAEITQPHLRGMLSATSTMSVALGVSVQLLFGAYMHWRTVALVNNIFPIISFILLFFVPESPYWLISKNRLLEAKKSLAWLRGWTDLDDVDQEYRDLCKLIGKDPDYEKKGIDNAAFDGKINTAGLEMTTVTQTAINAPMSDSMHGSFADKMKKFKKRSFVVPFILIGLAFFFGHFSGMTSLQTYSVIIFNTLKSPVEGTKSGALLGAAQFIGTVLCVILVHFTGKRPLVFISVAGSGICFIVTATYAHLVGVTSLHHINKTVGAVASTAYGNHSDYGFMKEAMEDSSYPMSWIPMVSLIGSALLSHVGIKLLPWILIGEIYPNDVRSTGAGLSSAVGYLLAFGALKTFSSLADALTLPGIFWFYGGIGVIGAITLFFFLPETEGKPLAEIELHFTGERKLQNSVRRKKKTNSSNGIKAKDDVESKL